MTNIKLKKNWRFLNCYKFKSLDDLRDDYMLAWIFDEDRRPSFEKYCDDFLLYNEGYRIY